MNEEQYWMVILKASECFSSQAWEGKEVAQILALTPTPQKPDWETLMNVIMDDLGIGGRTSVLGGCAMTLKIDPAYVDRFTRDKLPVPQWNSENLKLWVLRRSENA